MKCCVAVFALGLAVLTISETVSAKEYVNMGPEEIDKYLDDTYLAIKTTAKSLNLDPMNLPDTYFMVRINKGSIMVAAATNQVLTGMASLKRLGDGKIYDQDHKMVSVFQANDLEIKGQMSLVGHAGKTSNCTFSVGIEDQAAGLYLYLPENKTESLSVASLRVAPPESPDVVLGEGCDVPQDFEEAFFSKFHKVLREDLGNTVRIPLKEALNKSLKPFDPVPVSGH